ncbi:MAG: hypothetical protein KME12_04410 [Trichocoleus desertorum ATA4-8-CV12]|jgi:hypothetical protein|nr:hypothetical protein [Trichocoleus desertorum ATA4-8-CV12]
MRIGKHIKLSRQAELLESELESLKHSIWEIDCSQVTIKSRSPQNPSIFNGSGFLKQVLSHQLTFKVYANAEGYVSTNRNLRLGETIPEETYYDLTALDFRGRLWHCERILINIDRSASGDFVIQGIIPRITCEGNIPQEVKCEGSSLEIRVFDNINIPRNERTLIRKSVARGVQSSESMSRNAWSFKCCKLNFLLVKEDKKLLVINIASSQENIPEYLRERILETLQFILGYPINWATSYKRVGHITEVTLCSPRQRSLSSRFQPPFILGGYFINEAQVFRCLFTKYLQHIINYDQPLHPLWAQLNAIYEASSGMFIDAHALTLTVAIESIISSEFPHLGKLTKKEKNTIQKALKYIEEWTDNTGIKDRIKGSINAMHQPRVGDRMRALEKAGAITKAQSKAWQNLRNKSAHSYQAHSSESSKFVDLIFQINVLFYHLIFYTIGYKGPYMDVSEVGFPIKQYPSPNDTK